MKAFMFIVLFLLRSAISQATEDIIRGKNKKLTENETFKAEDKPKDPQPPATGKNEPPKPQENFCDEDPVNDILQFIGKLPKSSHCIELVKKTFEFRCGADMNKAQEERLALFFVNCHLESNGAPELAERCSDSMATKECVKRIKGQRSMFEKFMRHSRTLCRSILDKTLEACHDLSISMMPTFALSMFKEALGDLSTLETATQIAAILKPLSKPEEESKTIKEIKSTFYSVFDYITYFTIGLMTSYSLFNFAVFIVTFLSCVNDLRWPLLVSSFLNMLLEVAGYRFLIHIGISETVSAWVFSFERFLFFLISIYQLLRGFGVKLIVPNFLCSCFPLRTRRIIRRKLKLEPTNMCKEDIEKRFRETVKELIKQNIC